MRFSRCGANRACNKLTSDGLPEKLERDKSTDRRCSKMRACILVLWIFLMFPAASPAQGRKPTTIAELVTYSAKDREQVLYNGAKTEGKVTWYTSLAGESYKGMVKAFETKYAGVKVEAYRVSGSDMTTRMYEESKAKRYIADTVETTEGNLMFMRDAFLLRPYHSPQFASYPEDAKEKSERGLYFWAIARESYIGFAYNKKLLSKNAVAKNYEGLLHPELKGRMGVSVSDPSYKVVGAMLKTKGQEFVKKLKVQEIALHTIIPPALLDLIASGEVLASPAIFRNHTLNAIAKGAPVDWVPMDIVPTNVGGAAIAVQPPHPHAALLLADYLLGPEGQAVLEKFDYGSATKNLGFKRWRPDHGIVTDKYEKELEVWEKLLKEISRKGG
ncbi:MAG: extracellular solute-binding protein [Deltaproteobacteria bacterium]|nr:MAG: extracellular solute-binding protein [Deltaproteobacteria bacterium]